MSNPVLINVSFGVPSILAPQEVAQNHFNCPDLEGMEVENQGGSGTAISHWEKRLVEVHFHSNWSFLLVDEA